MKEETKPEDCVLVAETSDMKALKTKGKPNEAVSSIQDMQVIDFSFFDKVLLILDCHRVGDSCVPL